MFRILKMMVVPAVLLGAWLFAAPQSASAQGFGISIYSGGGYSPYGYRGYPGGYGGYGGGYGYNSFYRGGYGSPYGYGGYGYNSFYRGGGHHHHHHHCR